MSEYPPPRQPSSVYNSLDYTTFGSGGSSNSLNFPLAQGTETMGFGVVWGDGSYQNSAATDICNNSFVSYPTAQGQVSFPAGIVINGQSQTTAYTGYPTSFTPTAPNSLTLDSHGKITQIDNVDTNLSYVLNRGNDAGTLGMTNLGGMTQFGAASNSLNYTEINTLFGASATPGLIVRDTNSQKQFNLLPNVTAGAYNPATEAGNIQILGFKGGSQNTETLELTTWSSTNSAIKVNPTSVEVGAGGTGVTGTSNILCDGTTVNISPSVTYPDTTVQNSAFTGAGTLAGSYGLVNMTVDANGKITALSDESATYETVANAAATYETIANAALLAPLASPALTGTPTAPTAASSDDSTQIATTAFVKAQTVTPVQPNYFQGVGTIFPSMATIPGGWLSTSSFNSSLNPSGSNPVSAWLLSYIGTGIKSYAVDWLGGFVAYIGYQSGSSSNQGNTNRTWSALAMGGMTANTKLGKVGASNNGKYLLIPFGQAPQPPDTQPTYWTSNNYGASVNLAIQPINTNMKYCGGPMMSGTGKIQGATFSGDNQVTLNYKVSSDYGSTWTAPDFGLGAGVMANDSYTLSQANGAPSCMSENGQIWYKFYNTNISPNVGKVVAVRSVDGGQTFQKIGPWLGDTTVAPYKACCSAAGDTFYVYCKANGSPFTGNRIYYSYDYGETVDLVDDGFGNNFQYGPDTWVDCDSTGQMLVVNVFGDGGASPATKGLYVSRTGGRGLQLVDSNRNGYTCSISGNGQSVSYGPFRAAYQEAQFYA